MTNELEFDVTGIIVRSFPSGDADLILRVVTPNRGKLSLLAKHARKSRRRFGTSFDLFDKGVFSVKRSRSNIPFVSAFSPHASFHRLRGDLDKLALASLLCECFDLVVADELDTDENFMEGLNLGLEALEEAASPREALRAAYLSLSGLLETAGLGGSMAAPGSRELMRMLERVEHQAGRVLASKAFLGPIIERCA